MGVTKAQFSQGYCLNEECSEYCKGIFLAGTRGFYTCHQCKEEGVAETEKHWPNRYDSLEFSQVRLEYNFYAPERRYLALCVVTDHEREVGNVWNMQAPSIKTERLAVQKTTEVLGYLQVADASIFEPGIIVNRNTETMLSFDVDLPNFKVELERLDKRLRSSRLARI